MSDLMEFMISNCQKLSVSFSSRIVELSKNNKKLKAENQKLRDEISLMKGEQPKPDIKPSGKKPNVDISSEEERKPKNTPKNKKPKTKKDKITIDRVVVCEVDKDILPDDAEFKGYKDVVVQEIKIITDNTKYKKEIYYSPSQNKTYMGKIPSEIKGEFGPGVKSTILPAFTCCQCVGIKDTRVHEQFRYPHRSIYDFPHSYEER